MTLAAAGLLSCTGTGQSAFDPASVADASGEVTRVEPLSWWTGMQTPLQLLVNGAGIAAYDVRIEGGQGVGVKTRHKADSPNYLFVDMELKPDAEPSTNFFIFSLSISSDEITSSESLENITGCSLLNSNNLSILSLESKCASSTKIPLYFSSGICVPAFFSSQLNCFLCS